MSLIRRAVGYFIRFINNRDLAAENIMTAYSRLRLILDSKPGTIYSLNKRLKMAGLLTPERSMITLADDIRVIRGSLPGEYDFSFHPSRRNHRMYHPEEKEGLGCKAIYDDIIKLLRKMKYPATYKPVWGPGWSMMTAGTSYYSIFSYFSQYITLA